METKTGGSEIPPLLQRVPEIAVIIFPFAKPMTIHDHGHHMSFIMHACTSCKCGITLMCSSTKRLCDDDGRVSCKLIQ